MNNEVSMNRSGKIRVECLHEDCEYNSFRNCRKEIISLKTITDSENHLVRLCESFELESEVHKYWREF